jgi:hypothetical protein
MSKFLKGLSRDTNPVDQPAGTWRYARNIVIPPGSGAIQSERGNELVIDITSGHIVIGTVVLPDERICLFSKHSTLPDSEIGIYDSLLNTYTVIYNDSGQAANAKLEFNLQYPIQGEPKMDITGNISVYWTDDLNSIRYIRLYSPPVIPHDIEDFNIFPFISTNPEIEISAIQSGILFAGAYALAIAYLDEEGTPTNYLSMSKWVYVNDNPESISDRSLGTDAGYGEAGFTTTAAQTLVTHNVMAYNGTPIDPAIPSGKGIIWEINNLDSRFKFIRPAIIKRLAGVTTVTRLPDLDYDFTASTSALVSFTGNETQEAETLENLIIPRGSYTKAKTVAQVDDTLYWGNLVKSKIDIGYQPYAMNITIKATQANDTYSADKLINGELVNMEMKHGPTRNAVGTNKYTGYQRDEVYAFYISWITIDGNETVAYHIPGRVAEDISAHAGGSLFENDLASATVLSTPAYMDAPGASGDSQLDRILINSPNTQIGDLTTFRASVNSTNMGYWENKTEVYPIDSNYIGLDANDTVTTDWTGEPVRHHHIPSSCLGEGGGHISKSSSPFGGNHRINPMAIEVTDIPMPLWMAGQVVSYRIYYAKRTEGNALVIDTGIFNNMPSANVAASPTTWGSNGINEWSDAYMYNINGYNVSAPHMGAGWAGASGGIHDTPLTKDYAVQAPPGGDDYSLTTGGITGGDLVAYPFSVCAAPYTDVMSGLGDWTVAGVQYAGGDFPFMWRNTLTPGGNHFSFNGLHTRIDEPELTNISYLKVHKHLRIGNTGNSYMFLGLYKISYDESGDEVKHDSKLPFMIDWTQMPFHEYDNTKTAGTAYNVPPNSYFRAIGTAMNIPADQSPNAINSPAGRIYNAGGCQTTYLYTYNNLKTHDMSVTLTWWYTYNVIKVLFDKQTYDTCNGPGAGYGVNVPFWRPSDFTHGIRYMHPYVINTYGQSGYGVGQGGGGAWPFISLSVQNAQLDNDAYGYCGSSTCPYWNWENGWTAGFDGDHWLYWMAMEDKDFNLTCITNPYTQNSQEDSIIQYMAYGSVHRQISDVYTPFDLQSDLVYTGYQYDVSSITTAQTILNTDLIFGGDTYIDYYMETRAMKAAAFPFPSGGPAPLYNSNYMQITPDWFGDHDDGRYVHYVYGILGHMKTQDNEGMHEDIAQQLYITESRKNITMRHTGGNNPNEDFYPAVSFQSKKINTWEPGPRLFSYNPDYSVTMDVRPIVAFNHLNRISSQTDFPTRMIRSLPHNQSGLTDSWRLYLAAEYRDLPRHRGELWNISTFDNVLLPQTERSLLKTKGKETLKTGEASLGNTTDIALGSGNLFTHDPAEVLYTSRGHAGTTSQYAVIVNRYGHFSVDKQAGKVFLLGENLEEISALGMREFLFRRLTTWGLHAYGMPINLDIPTAGVGVIASWDPEYDRYVLTKLDKAPTTAFITAYDNGDITFDTTLRQFVNDGTAIKWNNNTYFSSYSWTVSYYPALKFWASVHDYAPQVYFYTSESLFSMSTHHIFEHNHLAYTDAVHTTTSEYNIAKFYTQNNPVEIEFISNISPEDNKKYSNFYYTVDVEVPDNLEEGAKQEVQDPGFNSFVVYNSRQMSQLTTLIPPRGEYSLIQTAANVRRKARTWYVNDFRDDIEQSKSTTYSSGTLDVATSTNILNTNHLTGLININTGAIDTTKEWNERRKFVDKWMAVRLIMNKTGTGASDGKFLVTLHSADATYKATYR